MKRLVYSTVLFVLILPALAGMPGGTFSAATAQETVWTQLPLGTGCPDWTRFDAHYYAGTGLVYIMGGRSGTNTDGTIYALNPATNTCSSTGLTMPVPISNYTIVQVNNGTADLLCTFGGRDSAGGYTTAVQCLNPVANTVSTVSTLPGNLGLYIPGGAEAVNNRAYVFSGFRNTTTPYHIVETWEWNPEANTWVQKGDYPLGQGYIQTAVADGKIWAFGGDVFDGSVLTAQVKTAVYDPALGTWNDAAVAELPTAGGEGRGYGFDTASGYVLAGKIVIAGGGQWPAETAEVFTYDIATNSYDYTFADLNIMRRNHAGFFVSGVAESAPGYMWVLGGRSSASGYGGDNPPYAPPETYEVAFTPPCEPPSNVDFSWDPATPCAGEEVTFTGTASGTPPLTYSWAFGDSGSGSGNPVTHTYANAGTYSVTLTVSNACGQSTVTKEIQVLDCALGRMWINKMKMNQRPAMQPGYYKVIALFRIYGEPPSYPPPSRPVIEGADAFGTWTYPDLTTHPQQAIMLTDPLGRTKFRVKEPQCGTYQFCLDDLVKAGYAYDPASNQMGPCMSINVPCK